MPYQTILIDIPIQIVPAPSSAAIDLGAPLVLLSTGSQEINGDQRHYYAAHTPLLLLMIARNGLDLSAIRPGAHVDALIGWDDGTSPYSLPAAHQGRKHSKISLFGLAVPLPGEEITPLSAVIARAPRLGQRGGNRPGSGRPALTGERMDSYDVTLPTGMATWLSSLAGGNLSAGVREAAHRAGYNEDPTP